MRKSKKSKKSSNDYDEQDNYDDDEPSSSNNTMYLLMGILGVVGIIGYLYYNDYIGNGTSPAEDLTIENKKGEKMIHNKGDTWRLIHENIEKRKNPNVLIIGNDTPNGIAETIQWNKGGQTIAILGQPPREDLNANHYVLVTYQGNQWSTDATLESPSRWPMLSFTLPQHITEQSWDVIIVDQSVGEKAGGLQGIYAAKEIAHSGTDLYFIDIKNPRTVHAIKKMFNANPTRPI